VIVTFFWEVTLLMDLLEIGVIKDLKSFML